MKQYRMPFEHWEDDHTALIRESKPPEFLDPEYYVRAHFHPEGSDKPYFLNRRCRSLYDRRGAFTDHFVDGEKLVNKFTGRDCYLFCPGPSMAEFDTSKVRGNLVMAVNSAGFAINPTYWVMAESAYARWLIGSDGPGTIPHGRRLITTARVAVCLREYDPKGKIFHRIYVVRWEEEFVVPPRVPAVSVYNGLVSAWQMGCSRVFLIGLDLDKAAGAYLEGVPHTEEGAKNPFHDQVKALQQFKMPGMQVYNGSPVSKDTLPFEYIPYSEMP